MDLHTVATVRVPRTRDESVCAPGEALLGGGTWLYSERQDHLTGLVDLTGLAWPALEVTDAGLSIAATCTFAELARLPAQDGWAAHPLLRQCCTALLGSFKVWNGATVGGNVALALPAGPMISLASALDARAVIWTPDGGERTEPVATLVTGVRRTGLANGEVLRSIEVPASSLRARTGFRRIALSPIGRSGTLVIMRVDECGEVVVTITAGTPRPRQLRFDALPDAATLAAEVLGIDEWYDDPHGAPDWRRAMSALLAEELRVELGVELREQGEDAHGNDEQGNDEQGGDP